MAVFTSSIDHNTYSSTYTSTHLDNGILVGAAEITLTNLINTPSPYDGAVTALVSFTVPANATFAIPSGMAFNLDTASSPDVVLTNLGAIVNDGTLDLGNSDNSLVYTSGIVQNNGTVNRNGAGISPAPASAPNWTGNQPQ